MDDPFATAYASQKEIHQTLQRFHLNMTNALKYIFSRQFLKITWLLVTWQCEYVNKQIWENGRTET